MVSGKSGGHYVFVIPIEEEIDFKKAAKVVGEKSLEMLHLKELTKVTGYVRGGCTSIGMKKQFVIEGGYDPVYGARPLKRFVQKEVETSTAKLILGGQVSEGDTILLDVENGGLKAMIKPGVEVVDE